MLNQFQNTKCWLLDRSYDRIKSLEYSLLSKADMWGEVELPWKGMHISNLKH